MRTQSIFIQNEVKLTSFQVSLGYLDTYWVTKLILVMMTSATQQEFFLVELVIVIVEVAHRYHAFAVVLIDLAVDTVARHATDVSIVDIANLVAHKLHHFIFYGVAFSILRYLFHVRAVFAEILIVLLVGRAAALLVFSKQTVYHRVRITADRRCEVSVVVEAQAEVTDVMCGVLCFHHCAQCHTLHKFALALALHVVHKFVDTLYHSLTCTIGLDLQAERDDKLAQCLHLLRVRIVVYTVWECLSLLAAWHFAYTLGNSLVG